MMDPPSSIPSNHPRMTIESPVEARESKIESDGDSHFVCWNWSSVASGESSHYLKSINFGRRNIGSSRGKSLLLISGSLESLDVDDL
nr:hypothetical protein CFP56_53008 [Quercus suber]